MSKNDITKDLEQRLYKYTNGTVLCSCFEVTIGFFGKERVDYLSLDYKNTWRCYEVKSCKADFYSKAHHTFIGNLNYYVMPFAVYEQVKNDVPKGVGVLTELSEKNYTCTDLWVTKKPVRQELKVDERQLLLYMLRSLNRYSRQINAYSIERMEYNPETCCYELVQRMSS